MKQNILTAALLLVGVSAADPKSWIKGVAPNDQHKYQPDSEGNWRCLGNPDVVISFDRVNDDYCDCPDGSDEPGTSACSNGHFFCENKGFRSSYLPSYKVNDGICDWDLCCDGSDEPEGVCANRCGEMSREYEQMKVEKNNMIEKGLKLKESLTKKAYKAKRQQKRDVRVLHSKIGAFEAELEELSGFEDTSALSESNNKVVEAFKGLRTKVDELNSKLTAKLKELETKEANLKVLENILAKMSSEYNHNFNDPAVKEAAQSFQEYAENREVDEKKSGEQVIQEYQTAFDDLVEKMKKVEVDLSKEVAGGVSERLGFTEDLKNLAKSMVDSFLGVQPRHHGQSVASMVDASKRREEVEKELKKLRSDLESKENQLSKDNGPDDILLAMDSCIIDKVGDYEYKLCFTDKAEQISSNGQATRIGRFERMVYDNETNTLQIVLERGDKCWNGPVRKGEVIFECGLEEKILAVTEPEKCEYIFRVSSPVGCFTENLLV